MATTPFITDVNTLTAAWITPVLQVAGVLESGKVSALQVNATDTNTASAANLVLTYSDDATGKKPQKLFFKIGRRYSEAAFHTHFAPRIEADWLLPCYHAQFANELGMSNLIFDDIAATHEETPPILPVSMAHNTRMVEILADLHRRWWEHDDLRPDGQYANELDDVTNFVLKQVQGQFSEFVDFLGDRLSEKRRKRYERILAALPLNQWRTRWQKHKHVTLAHGDPHWWNFALPKHDGDSMYLLDWAVWHVNTPGYDLSYMLTVRAYPEHRAHLENTLLRYYLAHLNVEGYAWDDLWLDYRMATIYQTIWAIFWHRFGAVEIWWSALECCMSAFDDLDCEALL